MNEYSELKTETNLEESKFLEIERLKAEIKKINTETEILRTTNDFSKRDKIRQKTSSIITTIVTILTSVGILGFYIVYVVTPTANINNIKLELENTKKLKELSEKERKLQEDSIINSALKSFNDSVRRSLSEKEIQFDSLAKSREQLDSAYRILSISTDTISKSKTAIEQQLKNFKKVYEEYVSKQKEYVQLNNKTECHFAFTELSNIDEKYFPIKGSVEITRLDDAATFKFPNSVITIPQGLEPITLSPGKYEISVRFVVLTISYWEYTAVKQFTVEKKQSQNIVITDGKLKRLGPGAYEQSDGQ